MFYSYSGAQHGFYLTQASNDSGRPRVSLSFLPDRRPGLAGYSGQTMATDRHSVQDCAVGCQSDRLFLPGCIWLLAIRCTYWLVCWIFSGNRPDLNHTQTPIAVFHRTGRGIPGRVIQCKMVGYRQSIVVSGPLYQLSDRLRSIDRVAVVDAVYPYCCTLDVPVQSCAYRTQYPPGTHADLCSFYNDHCQHVGSQPVPVFLATVLYRKRIHGAGILDCRLFTILINLHSDAAETENRW